MFTEEFFVYLFLLLLSVSIIFPLIIDYFKKLLTEDAIVKKFASLEWFCTIVSFSLGIIVYLVFLLFYKVEFTNMFIDIVRLVVIGAIFGFCSAVGAQEGYDKVFKVIKDIWEKFHPVK